MGLYLDFFQVGSLAELAGFHQDQVSTITVIPADPSSSLTDKEPNNRIEGETPEGPVIVSNTQTISKILRIMNF